MPYRIESRCSGCGAGDAFVIGQWPAHLGVFVCESCRMMVNVPASTQACPGCGVQPAPERMYDYSFAIPYLGGQMPRELEPGPQCPKCQSGTIAFENQAHINMGVVVTDVTNARAMWGKDSMEKAIFMNSVIPAVEHLRLDVGLVFEYFNLDIPTRPLITRRVSYPIAVDVQLHLWTRLRQDPKMFAQRGH